jgi:hypothetical protein
MRDGARECRKGISTYLSFCMLCANVAGCCYTIRNGRNHISSQVHSTGLCQLSCFWKFTSNVSESKPTASSTYLPRPKNIRVSLQHLLHGFGIRYGGRPGAFVIRPIQQHPDAFAKGYSTPSNIAAYVTSSCGTENVSPRAGVSSLSQNSALARSPVSLSSLLARSKD